MVVRARSLLQRSALVFAVAFVATGCAGLTGEQDTMSHSGNPVGYFEIPVSDMTRAIAFYESVFALTLERQQIDGYDMALFPAGDGLPGASGALAKGDVYVPGKAGAVLYFSVDSIDAVLARAENAGAELLYAKKSLGELGFVAEIGDSEGNRIALHESAGGP